MPWLLFLSIPTYALRLFVPLKQTLPPGQLIAYSLDGKDIFALPAAPVPESLIITCVGAAAAGAGGAYLSGCLFI